jgi:hypothetical protein
VDTGLALVRTGADRGGDGVPAVGSGRGPRGRPQPATRRAAAAGPARDAAAEREPGPHRRPPHRRALGGCAARLGAPVDLLPGPPAAQGARRRARAAGDARRRLRRPGLGRPGRRAALRGTGRLRPRGPGGRGPARRRSGSTRHTGCGAAGRSPTSARRPSPARRSRASRSCTRPRSRTASTSRWPSAATSRPWPSWSGSCGSSRCGSGCVGYLAEARSLRQRLDRD